MSDKMNKSLDDVIKERKKTEGKGKKGGKPGAKRGATGPKGRLQRTRGKNDRRAATRPTKGANRDRADKNKPRKAARKPISKPGVSQRFIRRTRAGGDRPAKTQAKEKPVNEASKKRLRVSNLDYNISHKDLMDLFSKFGSLVKNSIDYDDLGRSKGTATIEYDKHESALKAIEEYNGATLDGKTLSVEFSTGKTRVPKAAKKVIEKRDIRPVRRERRDDRRDDRRDNRRDNRRDDRRGDNRRDNRRGDNRRDGGNRNRRDDRRGDNRRDNRRGDNRRDGGNRNRRDDRRGGDNRKRGDNRRRGNNRGNRRGGNKKNSE